MADNIKVTGAGAPCDGEYSLLNELKTGFARVWMFGDSFRIYYNDGWKIANADITTIYYKLVSTIVVGDTTVPNTNGIGILNPWDTDSCMWVSINENYDPIPTVSLHTVSDIIVDEYVEEEDGAEVTVRKITNLSTGYVRYERTVDKEVLTPVITNHDRYHAPMLMIGRVYQFSFVNDFSELGYNQDNEDENPLKGIYRVDRLFTYFDLVTTGIDLYKNLYEPLGLSITLFNKDFHKLGNTTIYKLVDVTDPSVSYYMPLIFILGTPNSVVNLYNKVLMSIDIGAHFDTELLSDMKAIIEDVLEARWGIISKVNLAVYDKVWMPETYYKSIVEDRQTTKETMYKEHGDVLANNLFYVQANKLYKEKEALLSKLAIYEQILEEQQS